MISWWVIPGDWKHALIVTLFAFIALSAAFMRPKKRGASRLKKLRNVPLPDPWSGAIVRDRKFYVVNWDGSVGRAYRMMTDRSN